MSLEVVILAAGQGSRMKSNLPKVLHPVAGKPMVQHVIDTAEELEASRVHVVIGHGADQVKTSIDNKVSWALQEEQLGTGHAVAQALPLVDNDADILILYGDVPLINPETLRNLLSHVTENTLALLTVELDNPSGYGRIVRDDNGFVKSIVEQKDATPEQLRIKEINTGILALKAHKLNEWLPQLSNANAQGEYYLTDIIAMAVAERMEVIVAHPHNVNEVQGVNNRVQLSALERWHQQQLAESLMIDGVTLIDPARIDIRGKLSAGQDCMIDVNCVFKGEVVLGSNVRIESNCVIRNAHIGDDVVVAANSIIDTAKVGNKSTVGPFARLRPGTELHEAAKVGNFVETKKALIGKGSKVNHLSYVGDAIVGASVNVGAGTITCNYDGVNKFTTEIEDGVFVGSNTALVAPVTLGENATIGAGSTITKSVSADQLSIARSKQRNIDSWQRPVKKT